MATHKRYLKKDKKPVTVVLTDRQHLHLRVMAGKVGSLSSAIRQLIDDDIRQWQASLPANDEGDIPF